MRSSCDVTPIAQSLWMLTTQQVQLTAADYALLVGFFMMRTADLADIKQQAREELIRCNNAFQL